MRLNGSARVAYVTRYTEDWLYINTSAHTVIVRELSLRNRSRIRASKRHGRETGEASERGGCLSRVNNWRRISPSSLLSCHRLAVRRRFSAMRTPIPRRQWLLLPVQVPTASATTRAREPQDVAAKDHHRLLGAMHFGTYCFARTIVPSSTGKRADCSLFAHRLPKRMAQRKSERRSRSSEIQRPQTLTQLPILRHALFLQSTSQDRFHFSSYSATFRRSFETAPAASEQISALDCGGQASALKTHYNGA